MTVIDLYLKFMVRLQQIISAVSEISKEEVKWSGFGLVGFLDFGFWTEAK